MGAPPKGKGAAPPKGAAAADDEEPAAPVTYPKAEDHVNSEIKDFLEHFSSSRKITTAPPSNTAAFKRSDDDKSKILEEFSAATTAESSQFSIISEDRAKYRSTIEDRKDKEAALLELTRQEKADPVALKAAIEQAEVLMVKPKYVKKGKKFLEYMEYVKEFETHIQAAVAEKNKDLLQALLERFDQESAALSTPIPIDAKVLNDAKGNLAKMK